MIDPEKIKVLHSLLGDAGIVKDKLDYIVKSMNLKYSRAAMSDDELLFTLKSIVTRCDDISSTIEKEFRNE